jgi:hypothetical protein
MKKLNKLTQFTSKWIMVAIAGTLMVSGVINFLDQVDKVISYTAAFVITWLLLEKIL